MYAVTECHAEQSHAVQMTSADTAAHSTYICWWHKTTLFVWAAAMQIRPAYNAKYSSTLHMYLSMAQDDNLWQLIVDAALWAASVQMHAADTVKYSSTLHMCSNGMVDNFWQLMVNAAKRAVSMQIMPISPKASF